MFVRIYADNGLYGTGEGSPTRRITGETLGTMLEVGSELSRLLMGQDPTDIPALVARMRSLFVFNTTARCAFDMALYDLAAKTEGRPLFAFLGGESRSFWTDNTVGIEVPDVMAAKAVEFMKSGFRAVKVKLGTTANEDIERVRKIRAAIGPDVLLRIDANQGWSTADAITVLNAVQSEAIQYCEQPVKYWDYDGLCQVRRRTSIPIMADESVFDVNDAKKLADQGCCDFFNIKLAKSAGLLGGIRIADFAAERGVPCMVGSMSETRLGLSAAAHLVAAREIIRFADLDTHFDHMIDPVIGGVDITPESVTLSDAPGHGADIDPAFLAEAETITID